MAGNAGTGKTVLLRTLIVNALRNGVRVAVVTSAGNDINYLPLRPWLSALATTEEEALPVVTEIREAMKADLSTQPTLLVVDSNAALLEDKELRNVLNSLLALGRSMGVSVVTAAQHVTASSVPLFQRLNFGSRILMGRTTAAQRMMVLRQSDEIPPKDVPRGYGVYESGDGGPTVEFIGTFMSNDECMATLSV